MLKVNYKAKYFHEKYILISELILEGWMFGPVYPPEPGGEDMSNPEQNQETTLLNMADRKCIVCSGSFNRQYEL